MNWPFVSRKSIEELQAKFNSVATLIEQQTKQINFLARQNQGLKGEIKRLRVELKSARAA